MRRVHDEDGVEFEADRPRLDVAHAGQQQGRQHFTIRRAAFDPGGYLFEHPLARRVFQQAHQRLDRRMEPDHPRFELRLRR